MEEYDDNSNNDNKENIPSEKVKPIKNTKKKKSSSLTVKKSSLKETQPQKNQRRRQ